MDTTKEGPGDLVGFYDRDDKISRFDRFIGILILVGSYRNPHNDLS